MFCKMDIIDILDEASSKLDNQSSTGIDSDSLSLPFGVGFDVLRDNIV